MIFQFDERKGATWHCIVGRNFGSFVTHGGCLSQYAVLVPFIIPSILTK